MEHPGIQENGNSRQPLRCQVQWIALFLVCLAVVIGVLLMVAQFASQQEPEFYRQAMEIHPALQAEEGDCLEREVLEFKNSTHREGMWEATFTAQQINGWLATDLEEKFPGVVPPQFQNPRIAIAPDFICLACWYKDLPTNTILSLDVDVQLTETPNVVAIRIHAARAGVIPVPLGQVLNTISYFAGRAEIELRWANMKADPVALMTIPGHRKDLEHLLRLEILELREGEIYLSGRTVADEKEKTPPAS